MYVYVCAYVHACHHTTAKVRIRTHPILQLFHVIPAGQVLRLLRLAATPTFDHTEEKSSMLDNEQRV